MSELAIFTAPKPFTDGHIATIQRNALRAWQAMGPGVDVIIVGDEAGMADVARELNIKHISQVRTNSHGTPLVSSIFELARLATDAPLLAYVNADIIFFPETLALAQQVAALVPDFLLVGRRMDLDVEGALDFSPGWEARLRQQVATRGKPHPLGGSDYFIFPRHLYTDVPDFAIGRAGWDNWMIDHAVRQPWPAIDISPSLTIVHQNHGYAHMADGKTHHWSAETSENVVQAGGMRHMGTLLDVPLQLRDGAIYRTPPSLARGLHRIERWLQPEERVGRGLRWRALLALRRWQKSLSNGEGR